MYESLTVADGFLELSRERHRALTPMQLLKLDYIAHGWRLGLSRLTHTPGTPWAQTYEPGVFSLPITNDLIEDHYEKLAHIREDSSPRMNPPAPEGG